MNFDIKKLKKSEDVALFLGMLSGDGCLTIGHNGFGYRTYPIAFVNTNKDHVIFFRSLFHDIFKIKGSMFVNKRKNKKDLWHFQKCSLEIYTIIHKEFEFPLGKKALKLRVPSFILNGNKELQKYFFYGLLITDGSVKKDRSIMFHSASKKLLYDLKEMIYSLWSIERQVKEYVQRGKFLSYQLTLNKTQASVVLPQLPTSHNLALRWP